MSKSLIYQLSDTDFANLVKNSSSITEACIRLGYKNTHGHTNKLFKKRVNELEIDCSHFKKHKGIKRTKENVFCQNSDVDQTTLRKWYVKENTDYFCSICGINEWNNTKLTLRLDHINGVNNDNRLNNLRWVCPNCDSQLDTYCGRNRKNYCVDCGKEISQKAKHCLKCNNKKHQIVKEIDRNELKRLVRERSFTEIGRIYAVSDNTIRKWCEAEGLPSTKKNINSYTDDEWNGI